MVNLIVMWCISVTLLVASRGSFGKPLTEFESIDRKICFPSKICSGLYQMTGKFALQLTMEYFARLT